jgi:Domain of unknown function (DUF4352)
MFLRELLRTLCVVQEKAGLADRVRAVKKQFISILSLVSLFMASSALADGINYKINGVRVQKHIESAVAVEGATYLLVSVTMKNTGTTKTSIGELFGSNFKVTQGEYSFEVDGGAGFQAVSVYSGVEELTPLIPKSTILAFTVPNELASGRWTLVTPTGEQINL